jgi:predicted dithiol-disulfide oxidoreductase (DUF899 family)
VGHKYQSRFGRAPWVFRQAGLPWFTQGEQPGTSVFLRDGDRVFHTYSSYARGGDLLLGTYNYLDLTPLGRQFYVSEVPHHDRYEQARVAER